MGAEHNLGSRVGSVFYGMSLGGGVLKTQRKQFSVSQFPLHNSADNVPSWIDDTVLSLTDRLEKFAWPRSGSQECSVCRVHFNSSLKQKESFNTDLVYVAAVKYPC